MQKRIITFGTYDILHRGHLNILSRAAALGTHLTVGVSSDALNFSKKAKKPFFDDAERMYLVGSLKWVDEVFLEESLERKGEYIQRYQADVLVMGDDWAGRFDMFRDLCEVVYLPRTPDISTTDILAQLQSAKPGA